MEQTTLYQKVKDAFNELPVGARITNYEMIEMTGGTMKKVSVYMGSILKSGAAVRVKGSKPAIYEKVKGFRTEPRKGRVARAREREREFTAREIGDGVIAHIKRLEKTNNDQKKTIESLKNKINDLMKEVQGLSGKLEQSRKNVVVNRKAKGETIRFSLDA
jgi:hypothetical protein